MDKLAIYQFLGEQKIPYEKIEHPAVFNMEQLASIHLPHPGMGRQEPLRPG